MVRKAFVLSVLLIFSLLLGSMESLAQINQPERPRSPVLNIDEISGKLNDNPQMDRTLAKPGSFLTSQDANQAADIPLGKPGLSYRPVAMLGETEVAYFVDTDHLNFPYGIGTIGNSVWIGEMWGFRILKYTNDGTFQTSLGSPGFPDNAPNDAYFGEINDVAEDSSGNIWVVDFGLKQVVKLDGAGNLLLALGERWVEGTGENQFIYPIGVAFDAGGNIFVSDGSPWYYREGGNQRVQIYAPDGTYLATIGQTGDCGSAINQLCGPRHLAIYGNLLYVSDAGNGRVQVFDITTASAPVYLTTIGGLGSPSGVAVDADFIYVVDTWTPAVFVYNRTDYALVSTIGTGYGTGDTEFMDPSDVALDDAGNLYVADFANTRVQQFSRDGTTWEYQRSFGVTKVPYLTDGYHYNTPTGVAVAADGSVYITENQGHRLVKLKADGTLAWSVGVAGLKGDWDYSNDLLNNPGDVALDALGRAYVADRWHGRVQIYNPDGTYFNSIENLSCPAGVGIAPSGLIFVADDCAQVVRVYDTSLNPVTVIGTLDEAGDDNAHFNSPYDIAVDSKGQIYIADRNNHRIQVYNAAYVYQRTIGETGVVENDFGHLGGPHHIAIDVHDSVYITDAYNDRVQVFDSSGAYLTTIAGTWGPRDGQMRYPYGIALDRQGNLYVTEHDNHRVQIFAPGFPGWQQANINGFGDLTNGNIHTLTVFDDHLYAGTYNSAGGGAQLWKMDAENNWTMAAEPGFGDGANWGLNHLVVFDNELYAGMRNDLTGASIYRSSDGAVWDPVMTGGFGNVDTGGVYRLEAFDGNIYAGTAMWDAEHGAEIWRSPSGDADTWERVVSEGYDSIDNYVMRASAVHDGAIYFAAMNVNKPDYNSTSGSLIIRSTSGDEGSWTKAALNGFGDNNNFVISGLVSFDGYLYASTTSWSWQGIQVWRCQVCESQDDWEMVVDNGFGNDDNFGISNLAVHDDALYLVIGNPYGMQVWRSESGNSGSWEQLVQGGFGDFINSSPYFSNLAVYREMLFIGTDNWANGPEIWQTLKKVFAPLIMR